MLKIDTRPGISFPLVFGAFLGSAFVPFILWLIRFFIKKKIQNEEKTGSKQEIITVIKNQEKKYSATEINVVKKENYVKDDTDELIRKVKELNALKVLSDEEMNKKISEIEQRKLERVTKRVNEENYQKAKINLEELNKAGIISNDEFREKIDRLKYLNQEDENEEYPIAVMPSFKYDVPLVFSLFVVGIILILFVIAISQ